MRSSAPIDVILAQIEAAKPELDGYAPTGFKWYERCVDTAQRIVPWLSKVAPYLKSYVEEVANSKQLVRQSWKSIKAAAGSAIPAELRSTMDRELDREADLLANVGGATISKVIEKYLIEGYPDQDLESNGNSDYPDLFLRSKDYEGLPLRVRISEKDQGVEYGAAIKGPTRRPIRVPDGIEIKTCNKGFAVDCHHAHLGLHLVVLSSLQQGNLVITDIQVGFLRAIDYRMTVPKTKATTLKASFNGKMFVSILHAPQDRNISLFPFQER